MKLYIVQKVDRTRAICMYCRLMFDSDGGPGRCRLNIVISGTSKSSTLSSISVKSSQQSTFRSDIEL